MKIYRIAYTPDQNRKKIDSIEKDIKDINKTVKDLKREFTKITKDIGSLNIGQRRFWQQSTVFTSVQRKLEKLDKIEQEWNKYKGQLENEVKGLIEKKTRAQIG